MEKIDVFEDLDMTKMNLSDYNKKSIDEILFKIASGLVKLSHYTKEKPNLLV